MNVLFVLYHDFTSNSALHVDQLASELTLLGCQCAVAVPANSESVIELPRRLYRAVSYADLLTHPWPFSNGAPPDILHAWTPREPVRQLCHALRARTPALPLFIHLEDHENNLLACVLGRQQDDVDALPESLLESAAARGLVHPRRMAQFLDEASGITIVIDRLRELAPPGLPVVELLPGCDRTLFTAQLRNERLRTELGISPDTVVVAYTGNVHEANQAEVAQLYRAVQFLNQRACPATLLRTGTDFQPLPDAGCAVRHLGRIAFAGIPDVLAAADFLVQPGEPNAFNDFRVPSKLAEFFASGRPVILPAANLGLRVKNGDEALVLPHADAQAITHAILRLRHDPALSQHLAQGGRAFFERRLDWRANAQDLLAFYLRCARITASDYAISQLYFAPAGRPFQEPHSRLTAIRKDCDQLARWVVPVSPGVWRLRLDPAMEPAHVSISELTVHAPGTKAGRSLNLALQSLDHDPQIALPEVSVTEPCEITVRCRIRVSTSGKIGYDARA